MTVLFLSAWFPYPPDNGSRIRVYNLIRSLSRKHKVFVISLMQEDSRREDAEHLRDICQVVSLHDSHWFNPGTREAMLGFLSSRPRMAAATFDPCVQDAVTEAVERLSPDVMVVSALGVAEYLPDDLPIPSVLDEHNCEYAVIKRSAGRARTISKRLRYSLAWRKFARWEARMCAKFSSVAMVSEQDRRWMLEAAPSLRDVRVVPNGVDTDHYDPSAWRPKSDALIYNGALTYGANLDAVRYFANEVYPLLRQTRPDAVLRVTGRTAGVDLRGIADCPGIELTGYVEDIRNVLATSAVCVVPLREGGGSRLKILEAMAAGVPVVSTSMGAEGIDAVSGEHLFIADTPRDLADGVRKVLEEQELATALRSNARRFVEEHYSWASIGSDFARIVESLVEQAGEQGPAVQRKMT